MFPASSFSVGFDFFALPGIGFPQGPPPGCVSSRKVTGGPFGAASRTR